MNTRVGTKRSESPYAALPCILLLLLAGILVKFEIVAQLIHLGH